ncbi:protein mono-ADP-ribosyltransferase PARP14-like [Tachysurus fulvidraco]|uniref:protein mono-ADP-ribosyltransferase PARP14-like n=1 Tax=Tachysurus fulvidraco TaxID=1234273 RepID=UPI001FED5718|nr:protein mono-ADP-ribosyltransferase PARP14-like [Tachysurus fulvidraco]
MDEFPYPVLVEGDWSSINAKTLQSKVQIYFQSRKKSHGGDCVIRCSERSCTVFFKSEEIRDRVLAKADHTVTIEKQELKLKVSKPSSDSGSRTDDKSQASAKAGSDASAGAQQTVGFDASQKVPEGLEDTSWSSAVVLENVPEGMSEEFLVLLVAYSTSQPEEEWSVEFISESNAAVVTFNDPSAVENFLTECRTKKKFQEYGLKARHLEKSRSVKVENLPAQCFDQLLELYFEKHVGAVEGIKVIADEQVAIVTFKDHQVIPNAFGKKHVIRNTPLNIYPYFPSLGLVLYGKDRPKRTLSKPFTYKIHPAKGMAKDIEVLKPILKTPLKNASIQIERGKMKISDSIIMPPAIFYLFQQDGLQTYASAKYPQLELTYRKDKNQLQLAGLLVEIIEIKNFIMERRFNMKEKTLKLDSSLLKFLSSVDCEQMSRDLFTSKDIKAVYRFENGETVLTATTDNSLADAEKSFQMMLTLQRFPIEDLTVLEKKEWQDLTKELNESYNSSRNITVLIKSSEDRNTVEVCGFQEPVREVSKSLKEFVNKHSRIEESIRVKCYAVVKFIKEKKPQVWQNFLKGDKLNIQFDSKRPLIRVSGERLHVQPALMAFQNITKNLHTDKLTIRKAGVKKYFQEQGYMVFMMIKDHRFVVVLEDDSMREEFEESYHEESYGAGTVKDPGQLFCEVRTPGGIVIKVQKADICQLKVDAVVNSANEDLKHIGGLSLVLLNAAGPSLQQSSDQYIAKHGKLLTRNAITTEAGHLPCKYVVHAVGPRLYSTDRLTAVKQLRQAVRESLNQAVLNRCSSIAVPAISSGIFGFPLELCTETIAKELHAFIDLQIHQGIMNSLKEIHLVDNNPKTVGAMTQAVKKEFTDFNPIMTSSHQMGHGHGHHGQKALGDGNRGQGSRGQDAGRHHGNWNSGNGSRLYRAKDSEEFGTVQSFRGEWLGSVMRRAHAVQQSPPPVRSQQSADTFASYFKSPNSEASANEEFVLVGEEFEPVVFQLCGESQEDLKEAKNLITSFSVKEHMSSNIQHSAISNFSQEEADVLSNLQRELTVSIELSKSGPEPVLTVEGLTRDVVKAECQIRDLIRKVEKNMTRQRDAFLLMGQVEWQYQDSGKFVPCDILTNYDLEQALLFKKPCLTIKINNHPYEADLITARAKGKHGEIELVRIDLKQQPSVSLPSHWEDMKGKLVLRVKIQQGSQEYADVETSFRRTGLTSIILKIERVQNEILWKNYMNQKELLEKKNNHTNNEKLLFHGTGSDNIDKINDRGFNRSYAGMNGAVYGNGVYFAVDPSYSARGYARPDMNGHKRMYLARVLVGDFTTGKAGLLTPPAKNSARTDQYDSVTDPSQTMFVIFHDVNAYPEYLITFQ